MQRLVIALGLLLGASLQAQATYMYRYHDVRTKNQHDSNATATRKCDPMNQQNYDGAEFNRCMRALGWRFTHVEHIEDGGSSSDNGYSAPTGQFTPDGQLIPGSDR